MKFPVLLLEHDYFAYVVYNEDERKEMYTSGRVYVQSGAEIGDRHVDVAGNVYVVEEVVIVRTQSLWGIKLFDRWRPVEVEYRYRTPAGPIEFAELKKEVCTRTRQWETQGDLACSDLSALLSRIENTQTFEQLFRLLHDEL